MREICRYSASSTTEGAQDLISECHYRLSRVEYDRAVEAGAFEPDAKLELHSAGDKVAPLARPDAQIVDDDLLP